MRLKRLQGSVVTLLVLSGVTAVGARTEAAVLPLVEITCDEPVGDEPQEQQSFRLANNLECTGDGMTIVAPGITIDLNGRRVSGDDVAGDEGDVGFRLAAASGVKIQNGYVSNFDIGVHVDNTNSHTFRNLTVVDNEIDSILMEGNENAIIGNTFLRGSEVRLLDGLLTEADDNRIERNTFLRDGVFLSGADGNAIRDNIFRGAGTIDLVDGGVGAGSLSNTITGNTIIAGDSPGINMNGDLSEGNVIAGNTARGSSGNGIEVIDADAFEVSGNVTTGNAGHGIAVGGNATAGSLKANTASANLGDGIFAESTASIAKIISNVTNENGGNGIDVDSTDSVTVEGNKAKFNGFFNGQANDDDFGIDVVNADAPVDPKNVANGNDVVDPSQSQCTPASLCNAPGTPAADPPLIACNTTFATPGVSHTLRHPLDCGGVALTVAADDVKLDLGLHYVSGGTSAGNASVEVTAAGNDSVVSGGMLMDSLNGLRMGGFGGAVTGVTAARSTVEGVIITGDGDAVTRLLSLSNTGAGLQLTGADGTRIKASDLSGNASTGLSISGGAQNSLTSSSIRGNVGAGMTLIDSTSANVFERDVVIGNANSGIAMGGLTGSSANRIEDSTISANGNDTAQFGGILMALLGATPNNQILGNTIAANEGDGLDLNQAGSTGNVIRGNKAFANRVIGIDINSSVTGASVLGNKALKNGLDGIQVAETTNVTAVKSNVVNENGFVGADDDIGHGIFAPAGTPGCGNKGKNNDDPDEIEPPELKLAC